MIMITMTITMAEKNIEYLIGMEHHSGSMRWGYKNDINYGTINR